ncbi:hypothetical protein HUG12_06170 [Halorarum salinum]|uniref:Uncharacterized protein n=1 Tax=Halorarum salinum TaxID=2743089 RepID=A0A7D5QE37_9EURY|nr:hypothetical protein HUG12_06170 [Halobaculum salinum]
MKVSGGIVAAGLGGVALFSGGAAAEIEDYTVSATDITGKSDDGTLERIDVWAKDVQYGYRGLESPATKSTVELQAKYEPDGDVQASGYDWQTLGGDDATFSDETIGGQSQSGLKVGRLEADLLSHDGLDASLFEETEDGEKNVVDDVSLRLKVTIETKDNYGVTGDVKTDLSVAMQNIPEDAEPEGDAGGQIVSAELIGISPENAEADVETEGVLSVYGHHDGDERVFTVLLDEPWSDGDEPHANVGLGFDVDQSGRWDFQVNWSSADGIFTENDNRDDYSTSPDFTGEKDGEKLVFRIDEDEFDGDTFEFVANASYGGATHANVSSDPTKSWSPEDDFRSSEYFITVDVSA